MSSTARYRFEFRLLEWAEGFARQLCGGRRSFFIGLREDGSVRRVYFGRPGEVFDGERKHTMARSHAIWALYIPYEEPGAGYMEWFDLDPGVVERWLGRPLEPEDLHDVRGSGARDGWPSSWRMILR
ncbi:MAG: hypothetical protein JXX28_00790 [Deltaproteobacteria bacterium]|nr:hypothetical protein [Deltaproteobacteria bacterium]